ncbi:MAG: hypothetical protein FD180_2268 [Planctomycetota bacterium]|nr:MAG: hypothetical protein FD180_2268 [Planctomycetota bacterium]
MGHGGWLLALALSATSCGRDTGGPAAPAPAAPENPSPEPADTPAPRVPDYPPQPDSALEVALDLRPWKFHAVSAGMSTDAVRVSLFARSGLEFRAVESAADLAGLVAAWRSEEDVEEFYRLVDRYRLPELAEDPPGEMGGGSFLRGETRRLKWIRSIEGGFEAERDSEVGFGKAKVRGKSFKVTLKPHSYAARFPDRK